MTVEAASTTEPKPRKRRQRGDAEPSASEAVLPLRTGVPSFARSFPIDPELDALLTAFDDGAYDRVRREAPALAKRTEREDVRLAARELARRLDPDPLMVYLLAIAALLLVALAGWFWAHPHAGT